METKQWRKLQNGNVLHVWKKHPEDKCSEAKQKFAVNSFEIQANSREDTLLLALNEVGYELESVKNIEN